MEKIRMVCPCIFGLESVLSKEIKYLGGEDVNVTDGKVFFTGTKETLIDANINLRTAERVLIVLGEFKATTFEDLYQGTLAINWGDFIGRADKFPVKGSSLNSILKSEPACQSIIKKAIARKLSQKYKVSWFEETGDLYQVQFLIQKNNVLIMLDTSGEGLHKRGYRKTSVLAPIKETLAAGIVSLARVNEHSKIYDPCCGSGTLLIEAALKALKMAPGLYRSFSAESWGIISKDSWNLGRQKAISKIKKDVDFMAFGSDIDPQAIELAKANALKAGVSLKINYERKPIKDFELSGERNIVLCNPPYGERMLEISQAHEIYKIMGRKFEIGESRNSYYIISPDEEFEKIFGKKATKRRKLYNGMIKCQLYMYF